MSFDPLKEDPMDQVPAPAKWVVISFVGCLAIFIVYMYLWSWAFSI